MEKTESKTSRISSQNSRSESHKESGESVLLNKDFLSISNNVEKHNELISELKKQIYEIQSKPVKSCMDQKELKCLEKCLQNELKCLKVLQMTTVEKQSMNKSSQPWGPIPLSTTFEEDQMPRVMFCAPTCPRKPDRDPPIDPPESCTSEEDIELKLMHELADRNRMIESLQNKMQCLQHQLKKNDGRRQTTNAKPQENVMLCCCQSNGGDTTIQEPIESPDNSHAEFCQICKEQSNVKKQLDQIEMVVNRLHMDMASSSRRNPELYHDDIPSPPPPPNVSVCTDVANYDELKYQQQMLMSECAKHSAEINCLRKKLSGKSCKCDDANDDCDEKLEVLQKQIEKLQNEAEEFKILICEQQDQLQEYRQKFMEAQQKYLEQRQRTENLESCNRKIEEKVSVEICRIKEKFQKQLKDLAPMPQLLEVERLKNAEQNKCHDELKCKLSLICDELARTKKCLKKCSAAEADESWMAKCKKLTDDLSKLNETLKQVIAQRDCFESQLKNAQDELECFRTESSRLISRLKERAECARQSFQQRIDCLETELAQCRANSSIAVANRDDTIRVMEKQVNDLTCNFDVTQNQLKNLKNRMTFLAETNNNNNNNNNNNGKAVLNNNKCGICDCD